MTHWTRPRGLKPDERTTIAARLRAVADKLDAAHAATVQTNLEAWADPTPWPSSSGAAGSGSGPSSPVEAAIDIEAGSTTQARATRLLADLRELARLARVVDDGLAENDPHRTVAYCPNPLCGAAVAPGARCTTCSTRQQATPTCGDCGRPEDRHGLRPWPTESWAGWTDGERRSLCITDWMWRYRHDGRPRIGLERLALGADLIEQETPA